MRRGLVGFICIFLALAACGTEEPVVTCSSANCAGCCSEGICLGGTEAPACGTGGASCSACVLGEDCRAGACEPSATTCGPGNCTGCCDGNVCKPGTASNSCGAQGDACAKCESGTSCEGGHCQGIGTLCAMSCAGCCAGNTCHPGNTALACGREASSCSTCETNELCNNGRCEPDCALTCDGCCSGNTCLPGRSASACGKGGAACESCGPQNLCTTERTCAFEGLGLDADCSKSTCKEGLVCSYDSELKESRCRTPCPSGLDSECDANQACVDFDFLDFACVRRPVATSSWRLYVGRVRAAPSNGGSSWDGDGSGPDLKVCFDVPGRGRHCTFEASNTWDYTFKWQSTSAFLHNELGNVNIIVFDIDAFSDDTADVANNVDLRSQWTGHVWCQNVPMKYGSITQLSVCVIPAGG